MAAPSNTKWGSIVGGYGRIGISATVSNTNTQSKIHVEVWFWSKYSVSDTSNKYYYNNNATSATTSHGSVTIKTTVASGSGWSTSNQKLLKETDYTYNRGTSAVKRNCAAKLSGVDRVGGTMTVTTSYTIPALASYKITYNANGGSGAPGQQTKYYGKTLKLSSTKPTRAGYTFQGWGTSSTGSVVYAPGANYTANAADTLYAIWKANTWTVTYDANGGEGAPASQTKTYGVTLTLSSTKPTRTNYNFLGWATSASSTTVAYAPGASYTTNAATTLYAVWELAYIAPRITNVVVGRSTSSGELSDEGTYARISFNWETDKTVSSVQIGYRLQDTGTYQYTTVSASGVSGSVDYILNGSFDAEQYYDIEILITDSLGSNNVVRVLEAMKFIIDIKSGGAGIAFNKPASLDGFDVNFESYFRKPINLIDAGGDGVDWELVPKLQELSDGVEKNTDDISELNNKIGNQKILWQGAHYMTASQTIHLSQSVNAQKTGLEFVFSAYDPDSKEPQDYYWNSFFFSKTALDPSGGKMFNMYGSQWAHKYLYVGNTEVIGSDSNDDPPNNKFVLRYVIGV